MSAIIYCRGQAVIRLSNSTFGYMFEKISSVLEKEKIKITKDKEEVLDRLYLCMFGTGFDLIDVFKSQAQAKFLTDVMNKVLITTQSSEQPFEKEDYDAFQKLLNEIACYEKQLSEQNIN